MLTLFDHLVGQLLRRNHTLPAVSLWIWMSFWTSLQQLLCRLQVSLHWPPSRWTGCGSDSPYNLFVSVMFQKWKPNIGLLLARMPGIISLQSGGFIMCNDWVSGTSEFHMMIQLIHHSVQMSVNHWVRRTWPMTELQIWLLKNMILSLWHFVTLSSAKTEKELFFLIILKSNCEV